MGRERVELNETDRTRLGVPVEVGEKEGEGARDPVSDPDSIQLNRECVRADSVRDTVQNSVAVGVEVGVLVALLGDRVSRNESVRLSVGDRAVMVLRDCEAEGVRVSVGEGSVGLGDSETDGAPDRLSVTDPVPVGLKDGDAGGDAESVREGVWEAEGVRLNERVASCVGGDQDAGGTASPSGCQCRSGRGWGSG